MKDWIAGLRRWWLRKFRGVVAPPAQYGGQGTTWQQWPACEKVVTCACGQWAHRFTEADLVIRSRNHREDCAGGLVVGGGGLAAAGLPFTCDCPIADARYTKICPNCRRGHWKQAAVKETR